MSDPYTERQRKYAQKQRQERLREMRRQLSHTPTPSGSDSESSVPSASGPTSSRRSDQRGSRSASQSGDGGESSSESASQGGSGQGRESPSYQPSGSPSSDHASGSYGTDEAVSDSTQRATQFHHTLSQRKFTNTRIVDFSALQTMGLEQEFLRLTGRIGISPSFWTIAQRGYSGLTLEFLSSLELKYNKKDTPYIKFRLRQVVHRVWLSQLREWFGFAPNPTTDSISFSEDLDRDHFWELISGKKAGTVFNKDFKQLNVPHPVLRCILRILGGTFFARGETMPRANVEDLQLLDHMLRPDDALERPDLMLVMIQHWLGIQRATKVGGIVSISAYVTLIAERLGVQISDDVECTGARYFSLTSLHSYKFIQPATARDGRGAWAWRMPGDQAFYVMPFPVTLSFDDRSTWFFTRPPRIRQGPAASPSPPPQDDVEMHDAHTSPVQDQDEQTYPDSPLHMHPSPVQVPPFFPQGPFTSYAAGTSAFGAGPSTFQAGTSTSTAGPSHEPTMRELYALITSMQATQISIQASQRDIQASQSSLLETQLAIQASQTAQTDAIFDIQADVALQSGRIRGIEDQMTDWRFFMEHGYWPDHPPT